jgi:hypothetical protein
VGGPGWAEKSPQNTTVDICYRKYYNHLLSTGFWVGLGFGLEIRPRQGKVITFYLGGKR